MKEPRLLGKTGERSAAHICKAINTTDSMQRTRYTFKALKDTWFGNTFSQREQFYYGDCL